MLRQCFSSGTAADGHTPYKARPSQNWPKITTYDHVQQIFITSCTWFRREFCVTGAWGPIHLIGFYGNKIILKEYCHFCSVFLKSNLMSSMTLPNADLWIFDSHGGNFFNALLSATLNYQHFLKSRIPSKFLGVPKCLTKFNSIYRFMATCIVERIIVT